jgi:hypothetical protein
MCNSGSNLQTCLHPEYCLVTTNVTNIKIADGSGQDTPSLPRIYLVRMLPFSRLVFWQ